MSINRNVLSFLMLMLLKHRSRHIAIVLIATFLLALLASVLFLSRSLSHDASLMLQQQSDFIVQRLHAGKITDMPQSWQYDIEDIAGVSEVTPRVYGTYYVAPMQEHFLIVGIDFFDNQSSTLLKTLTDTFDLKSFLAKDRMYISQGIHTFLKAHYYENDYAFRLPDGTVKKVEIAGTFSKESAVLGNDIIIMPMELARDILGMEASSLSDISFNVPNPSEWHTITAKLYMMYPDIRVITKADMTRAYTHLFNYKGGFFLILFLITLITFMLILYQRYTTVYSSEKKEIGIMRAVGWSIHDVLMMKFVETLVIILVSFVLGVCLAYLYVYGFNAPLLQAIFLGSGNLPRTVTFVPVIDFATLSALFLLFSIPFMAAVLIPVWRIATTEPKEAMMS